jgi:hypothetical protein
MQQTHCYATGTATLLWKRNRVHRSCHQGNPKYVTVYLHTISVCFYIVRFQVLTTASMMFRWDPWWWRQYAPLKRRSTIILHGSTTQKTALNMFLHYLKSNCGWFPAVCRLWNISLEQRFPTCGPRTTGGPRRWARWSADEFKQTNKK